MILYWSQVTAVVMASQVNKIYQRNKNRFVARVVAITPKLIILVGIL